MVSNQNHKPVYPGMHLYYKPNYEDSVSAHPVQSITIEVGGREILVRDQNQINAIRLLTDLGSSKIRVIG